MQGLVDGDLAKHLEGVSAEGRVEAINKLLDVHRLSLSRTADGSTFYIGITAEEAQKYILTLLPGVFGIFLDLSTADHEVQVQRLHTR